MCTSPDHEDCLGSSSRREALKKLAALGLSVPAMAAMRDRVHAGTDVTSLNRDELVSGLKAIIARAKSPELLAWQEFSLNSGDMPWKDLGLAARTGQARCGVARWKQRGAAPGSVLEVA